MNSWTKCSEEFLDETPGGIAIGNPPGIRGENPRRSFWKKNIRNYSWRKSPDKCLEQIFGRILGGHSMEKFLTLLEEISKFSE